MDRAFPDYHYTIEELIAEGDKIVARWTFSGTQKGEYMGIAAIGKHASGTGTSTFRIFGGKIVEELVDYDALGIWQQLGAVPPLGLGKGQAAG
jgi:predicted ester cyclase